MGCIDVLRTFRPLRHKSSTLRSNTNYFDSQSSWPVLSQSIPADAWHFGHNLQPVYQVDHAPAPNMAMHTTTWLNAPIPGHYPVSIPSTVSNFPFFVHEPPAVLPNVVPTKSQGQLSTLDLVIECTKKVSRLQRRPAIKRSRNGFQWVGRVPRGSRRSVPKITLTRPHDDAEQLAIALEYEELRLQPKFPELLAPTGRYMARACLALLPPPPQSRSPKTPRQTLKEPGDVKEEPRDAVEEPRDAIEEPRDAIEEPDYSLPNFPPQPAVFQGARPGSASSNHGPLTVQPSSYSIPVTPEHSQPGVWVCGYMDGDGRNLLVSGLLSDEHMAALRYPRRSLEHFVPHGPDEFSYLLQRDWRFCVRATVLYGRFPTLIGRGYMLDSLYELFYLLGAAPTDNAAVKASAPHIVESHLDFTDDKYAGPGWIARNVVARDGVLNGDVEFSWLNKNCICGGWTHRVGSVLDELFQVSHLGLQYALTNVTVWKSDTDF